ncbi:Spo0E family sporulation regulatory protein-aspartic acid phosphatase [Clostridium sp. DL1XJH146]
MKFLIENSQDKLNKLIIEKDFNLQDEKLIKLSEKIDKLLVNCTLCKKNRQHQYILLSNGEDLFSDNKFGGLIKQEKIAHKK